MIEVPTTYQNVLYNRSFYNVPLNYIEYETRVYVFCVTPFGIYSTYISVDSPEYQDFVTYRKPFGNQPVFVTDKRIVTHNFGNNSTWVNGPNDSTFEVVPDTNKKLIVTSIIVRSPKNLKLTQTNQLVFEVWLSPDGVTPPTTPKIYISYASLRDIVRKSNVPIQVANDVIPDVSTDKVIEITFRYCDPDTLRGAPIVLRQQLDEKIKIYLSAHQPVRTIDNQPLTDECWAVVVGRQTLDF